jgi:hypothetical protein
MSSHRSTRLTSPRRFWVRRWFWLVSLSLALTPACSRQDQAADPQSLVEAEVYASEDEVRGMELRERLDEDGASLRSLGYASDVAQKAAARPSAPPQAIAKPSRKAPDTGALSELDYFSAQNSSQQTNEALDYLGPQDADALMANQAPTTSHSSFAKRDLKDGLVDSINTRGEGGEIMGADKEELHRSSTRPRLELRGKKLAGSGAFAGGRIQSKLKNRDLGGKVGDRTSPTLTPAQRFERERQSLEGLAFQSSSGYWANNYVPGDPVLRWLESRLEERDAAALQAFAPKPLLLETASRQTSQPFDPPGNAALSVFVQSDRRGLEREERMLVQVGLQGANRRGGLRPAMTVGVVLDARGSLTTESGASMRALLEAFLAAKDVGDRFSLTLAGQPGGKLVGADDFRHGPLSLAIGRLFEPAAGERRAPTLTIRQALEQTADALARGDDPDAPLGSSMVVLVTSQPLGPHTDALVATAHRSAVAGVPVSVVAVGDGVDLEEVQRVALAGQGNRRILESAADAEDVVDRELSALSRVIARALRLNIRLAPGVKLVEVVGTERLDAAGAQQVRRAEQSIDRRLSSSLGIAKDRGEDEDGIQIVIPTFHSGDSHAVLLDVVASGPGPIADVTVRYKDLVYLRNSVARTNLSLARGSQPAGPLERNVVKNFLAVRLAGALKQAGRSLLEGGDEQTVASVRDFRSLLESLRSEVPSFRNDSELRADSAMLGEYLALLETGVLDRDEPRRYLADSLQLSGYFKTVPRSAPVVRIAKE